MFPSRSIFGPEKAPVLIVTCAQGSSFSSLLKFFKKEHWMPKLLDRQTRSAWEKTGSKDLATRANERTKDILSKHQPTPLSKDIENDLDNELKKAEKKILQK